MKFINVKLNKPEGLFKRKTWKIICRSDIPPDAIILYVTFILANKDERTNEQLWKARFFVLEHKDSMKESLIRNNAVDRQQSAKIIFGIAAIFGFKQYSLDVTQTYLKSSEKLIRDVHLNPPKEMNLKPS